ncbi:sigma-70 family RNA polymerase sigma factor [Nanoarchaeota archaeon]
MPYDNVIGSYPLLTREQEQDLGRQEDPHARDTLILSNLRLVMSMAGRYKTKAAWSDLIGAGLEGLCIASDDFDPDRGTRFSTYASWWIRSTMAGCVQEQRLIKIPPEVIKLYGQLNSYVANHITKTGEHPTIEEIAEGLTGDPSNADNIQKLLDLRYATSTTNMENSLGEPLEIPDYDSDPIPAIFQEEITPIVNELLQILDPRERLIMTRMFYEDKTQADMGRELSLSRERIRQIYNKAIKKMKTKAIIRLKDTQPLTE